VGTNEYIKGTLTLNTNYIIFNPLQDDQENMKKFPGKVAIT
jgi:hypothetical protein